MMRTFLYQRMKTHSVILINAGSLIGTSAVTSVLGFAYWWLAARQFTPQAVGFASAAISAMMLLGTVGMLGLGTLLIGELPRQQGKEISLINAALILVGGVAGCIGIIYALVAPYLSRDFQALSASFADIALFAVGVSLTAITLVLDQALIGLLRGELQLWRNALFAAAKLAVLFVVGLWLSHSMGLAIYATWAIGNALSLVALAGYTALSGHWSGRACWPRWELLHQLKLAALEHHLLNLTLQVPSQVLPILVTILLSATMNAWFYVSLMLANFVFLAILALTTVLYATGSASPGALRHQLQLTLALAVVISLLANAVLLFGTKQVLALFGHNYAEQAAWSLRILGLGAFPQIIKNHYVAVRRIQGRIAQALLPITIGALFELVAAALGARLGGVSGLSLGWVVALCIESIYMFLPVYQAARSIHPPRSQEEKAHYSSPYVACKDHQPAHDNDQLQHFTLSQDGTPDPGIYTNEPSLKS